MGKSTYIKLQQKCYFDDVDIWFKMLLHNKNIVVTLLVLMSRLYMYCCSIVPTFPNYAHEPIKTVKFNVLIGSWA